MPVLIRHNPDVTATDRDEDVSELAASIEQYYRTEGSEDDEKFPPGLDGAMQAIFEMAGHPKMHRRPFACPPPR